MRSCRKDERRIEGRWCPEEVPGGNDVKIVVEAEGVLWEEMVRGEHMGSRQELPQIADLYICFIFPNQF